MDPRVTPALDGESSAIRTRTSRAALNSCGARLEVDEKAVRVSFVGVKGEELYRYELK